MNWKEKYRNALLDTSTNPPDIRKMVKPNIPQKLYKYGSFQSPYWPDAIYKAQIYLSPANTFNDPFDCRANFDYQKLIKSGAFRKQYLKNYSQFDLESLTEELVQKHIVEGMREDIFVFCFSEIWDSLLMWAHYANNYNGYCLEYNMNQVRDYITYNLYPVLYENDYIDITESLINATSNAGHICTLSKAHAWSYEKEWRIVKYNSQPLYLKKALNAIHIGTNCKESIKNEIIDWAKNNNKAVYIIKASKNQYKLERVRIL